jgi:hypothetical protein
MFQALSGKVEHVSLLWSDENLLEFARSINISSLWDEEAALRKTLSGKQK